MMPFHCATKALLPLYGALWMSKMPQESAPAFGMESAETRGYRIYHDINQNG
jgi:hypothetical protein